MFRRRRQLQQFLATVQDELDRVGPVLRDLIRDTNSDLDEAEQAVAGVPGAAARCPDCGRRMTLERAREGKRWWTLWHCASCGTRHRPAEFPSAGGVRSRR